MPMQEWLCAGCLESFGSYEETATHEVTCRRNLHLPVCKCAMCDQGWYTYPLNGEDIPCPFCVPDREFPGLASKGQILASTGEYPFHDDICTNAWNMKEPTEERG